jgi:hypothetical protein
VRRIERLRVATNARGAVVLALLALRRGGVA